MWQLSHVSKMPDKLIKSEQFTFTWAAGKDTKCHTIKPMVKKQHVSSVDDNSLKNIWSTEFF